MLLGFEWFLEVWVDWFVWIWFWWVGDLCFLGLVTFGDLLGLMLVLL